MAGFGITSVEYLVSATRELATTILTAPTVFYYCFCSVTYTLNARILQFIP